MFHLKYARQNSFSMDFFYDNPSMLGSRNFLGGGGVRGIILFDWRSSRHFGHFSM